MNKNYTHVVVHINTRNKTERHRIQNVVACKTIDIANLFLKSSIEGLPGYFEVKLLTKQDAFALKMQPVSLCYKIQKGVQHLVFL